MIRAGQELRMLADAFAETEERKSVRRMAEKVNMASINMENFFSLCGELFHVSQRCFSKMFLKDTH